MRILISAGEASSEMYGAELIRALRRAFAERIERARPVDSTQALEFFGAGGERMRAAGCDIVVDAKDLAVVGISEIVGHLPKIWKLFQRLVTEADERKPDLAIVIDSPAFNWRVARQMHKRRVPIVYYVAPQFWAWRQGRVRLIRKYIRKALVIFPFEEKFYRERGVDAVFIGHPLAKISMSTPDRDEYAHEHKLNADRQWITLMPGSRMKEVKMNLPTMLESAAKLGSQYEFLLPVAPTLDFDFVESLTGTRAVRLVRHAPQALSLSRAGIIASGTATVEAALIGVPFVMVYRVTPLTYLLGRWRVKVPYFAMVNLIAGKEVVPELVQAEFTSDNLVRNMQLILADGPVRDEMIAELRSVKQRLQGSSDNQAPAPERAAEIILDLMECQKTSPIPA